MHFTKSILLLAATALVAVVSASPVPSLNDPSAPISAAVPTPSPAPVPTADVPKREMIFSQILRNIIQQEHISQLPVYAPEKADALVATLPDPKSYTDKEKYLIYMIKTILQDKGTYQNTKDH
ncbi:hypothetical protein GGI12_000550 [Dipsacomyces acuminosporus]|nr:hypothetical protein GGI12_000550 [Dipsacomyces acuminosporus]